MRLVEDTLVAGRYRLLHRIGSGGMADVWLADDAELDRHVALKVLHERFAQDREFVERFRREASAAAGLQHPNVVGVFDRGEFEGTYFIAMEYVEGSALNDLIAEGLTIPQTFEITRQILAAARYAHERGIVHRDIKPQNVVVDPEGRVRVLDFGIARAGVSEITQTGSVMGTAQYLSPEQAQGLATTPASDIYSTGIVLYEMLTGRVPFEGDSAVAVALKQVSEQPVPPSRPNPHVPAALDTVVLRALAKDPANRYASAEEFSHALDLAEADPSGAGLGDTAAYAAIAVPAEESAELSAEDRRRRRRWIAAGVMAVLLVAVAIFALTRPDSVPVPSVLDSDVERAVDVLEGAGFEAEINEVSSPTRAGTVLEQFPLAGEEAPEGSTIELTVSTGPGEGEIPDVTGLTEREAVEELEEAGFRVRTRRESSSAVEAGEVIRTDPSPGLQARLGSRVEVFVSRGPKLATVPEVLGSSREVAESELRQAGFVVNVESREDEASEGTVIEQSPGGGSEVEEGSEVTIVVSQGPGDVTVPNVVGQRRDSATSRISGLGLDVRIVEVETETRAEDDRVLDQFPSSGAEVPPGSDVTIEVGVFTPPTEVINPGTPPTPIP